MRWIGGWEREVEWRVGIACVILAIVAIGLPAQAEEPVVLWRGTAFQGPWAIAVNEMDSSCWVGDTWHQQAVHLNPWGEELWRGAASGAWSMAVNSVDDSVWIAHSNYGIISHLAADASVLWEGGGFIDPVSISVNPSDGSCWVADGYLGKVLHLAENGTLLWEGEYAGPWAVSVNVADGSCWIGVPTTGEVVHVAENGTELWRSSGFGRNGIQLSVDPGDSSCWVTASDVGVIHLAENGTELFRRSGGSPIGVAVDPIDGSCWVGDYLDLIHYAADGTELSRLDGFFWPWTLAVNPLDGSCWVAEPWNNDVVHVGFAPQGDVAITYFGVLPGVRTRARSLVATAVVVNSSPQAQTITLRLLRDGVPSVVRKQLIPALEARLVMMRVPMSSGSVVLGLQAALRGDPTPVDNAASLVLP